MEISTGSSEGQRGKTFSGIDMYVDASSESARSSKEDGAVSAGVALGIMNSIQISESCKILEGINYSWRLEWPQT